MDDISKIATNSRSSRTRSRQFHLVDPYYEVDSAVRKRIANWSMQEARTDAVRRGNKSSLNILAKMKERA